LNSGGAFRPSGKTPGKRGKKEFTSGNQKSEPRTRKRRRQGGKAVENHKRVSGGGNKEAVASQQSLRENPGGKRSGKERGKH